ncbi:hypothetical protein ACIB24_14795 [Spongisporangium articulatum]|uniref:Bacteriocin biosynthesis cyclodehydratase domain-containing protein n=1 Tax=Spongisporangium articulatum TaxID=3362603 RepID=A0ABW8APN1_9ACTN
MTGTTGARVGLRRGLACTWVGPEAVQIGLSGRFGVQVHGLAAADARLISRLAKARPVRPQRLEPQGRRLLQLLDRAGVLERVENGTAAAEPVGDAAVWSLVHGSPDGGHRLLAHRAGLRVEVRGRGQLVDDVLRTLSGAGIGTVERVRGRAHLGLNRPDLVVLVEPGVADAPATDVLVSADVAHLSVVVREAEVLVGPLVVPGDGPCLRCLDLHRTDRDGVWPRTVEQLLAERSRRPAAWCVEETALSTLGAGLAAVQVLTFLDGRALDGVGPPAARGATLEVTLPDGLAARRPWGVHPRCGCTRLPGVPGARARAE